MASDAVTAMLMLTNQASIRDVILFPILRNEE